MTDGFTFVNIHLSKCGTLHFNETSTNMFKIFVLDLNNTKIINNVIPQGSFEI